MAPKKKVATKVSEAASEHAEGPEVAEAIVTDLSTTTEAALTSGHTPTEIYAQLQQAVTEDTTQINHHLDSLLSLVHAAEDATTPILLRVRFLEFIAKHVVSIRDNSALKKIVTSLVKIIGGDDNTPQLLVATLQCFNGLGPVSMLEKQSEYLSREGADVLMQILIDKEAFSDAVRQAAHKSLDALTQSALRPVVTKLIHWLSNDREDDDEEQLVKERHMALTVLNRLSRAQSLRAQWTDEVQEFVYSLILHILDVVDVREFTQLVRIATHLPLIAAKSGFPLLESYLSNHKLDNERHLEAVTIIGRFIPTTDANKEYDMTRELADAGLLQRDLDGEGEHDCVVARVLLLAARLGTPQAAEKLLPYVFQQLGHLTGSDGNMLPENLTTLEAILFAAVALSHKKPMDILQKLNDRTFQLAMNAIAQAVASLEKHAIYAVKKKVQNHTADDADAEMLACLHNIYTISSGFSSKHLIARELKESWIGKQSLPAVKQKREVGNNSEALPPPSGSAAAAAAALRNPRGGAMKRQRIK